MRPAIRISGVGKQYRLGELTGYKTLRESLAASFRLPGRRRPNGDGAGDPDRTIWALRDITFDVAPGEVVGVIGHNGAGKTTLLKILSRITEPTTGEIELHGRVSSLLEVGTGFHPELTGRENIYLNGSILGMRRAEIAAKFDEIVDFSGVEKFLDTPVKRYSSGMQVRLAFAVAAHLEPEILLVDEVLAVGDAEFQRKCIGKMDDIAESGRTIIFVSHNMAAVQNLCSRGMVIEHGKVAVKGPVETCIESYLNRSNGRAKTHRRGQYLELVDVDAGPNGLISPAAILMGTGFKLKAVFRTPRPTARPKVGVVCRRRATGEPVFGVNTSQVGVKPQPVNAERFEVMMTVSNLNLVQGNYTLDLYLGDEFSNFEVVHDAVSFEVISSNIYGSGNIPYSHTGPVYFVPEFEISSAQI